MAVVTPVTGQMRLRLNDGTTSSGLVKTKTMSLFPTSLAKESLDAAGYTSYLELAELIDPCLTLTLNRIEYVAVSTVTGA